jgi:acrylyl-CoA reductase (NADPH)
MPTSPAAFRAFRASDEGGRLAARSIDLTLDDLSAGSLVIKAAYSSVNYKDALAATGTGKVTKRLPLVLGIDVSGTVAASEDPRFKEGQPVLVTGFDLGVAHDGGYSQYVRVPAEWAVPLPPGLDLFEAMAIGTAGFTAGLSIVRLERNGLKPGTGPVIVTGATGGVGSIAVASLAALGYQVTALTGKDDAREWLTALGAADILLRSALTMGSKPLEKSQWAGAVDPVGGDTLAWLTRTMMYGASIANSGLTGGTELRTTVMPFILRGVNLLGIDSVMCPMPERLDVWRRLAGDMKPRGLRSIATEVGLDGLPEAFRTLLDGQARGRFVVALE